MNEDWIKILEYSIGGISILGCFFIIFVYFCNKQLRSFPFESVVYLTFSSMMTTFSYLFYYLDYDNPDEEVNEFKCKVQAFMMIWFENSQYIWAALIGYGLYQSIINFEDNKERTNWSKRGKYLMIGYGIPFIMSCICWIRNVFGRSGSWCWIQTFDDSIDDPNYTEKIIFAIFFYFFVWVLIFLNFALNYQVIRFLNRNFTSSSEREIVKGYIMRLLVYPIIQVVCIFPGTINRLLQIFFDVDIYSLHIIQLIAFLLQGLMYAIAYGFTSKVRKVLLEGFDKYCYCCFCFLKCIRRSRTQSEVSDRLFDRPDGSEGNVTLEDKEREFN